MKIQNANQEPKVYFGMHMAAGVAEYKDESSGEPYRIYVNEETAKLMDASFQGKPVYVEHVDRVDLDKIQQADGFVIDSFFNKADGKHWAKFIIVSDKAHEALRNGWKLSNAYIPEKFTGGGLWHGVEYLKEITGARYEHLAIVPNPRYSESVILTPEQFKEYNDKKELELKKLSNSNKGVPMKFSFFKKEKIENGANIENMSVVLPNTGKEVTIAQLINDADAMKKYAHGEHMVKLNDDEEMPVHELVKKYKQMCDAKKNDEMEKLEVKEVEAKKHDADEASEDAKEAIKENVEEAVHVDIDSHKGSPEAVTAKNDEVSEEELKKKKNKEGEAHEKAESPEFEKKEHVKKNHFDALKNAPKRASFEQTVDLAMDKVARGKNRYGSGK
jgi:hypothetical protein